MKKILVLILLLFTAAFVFSADFGLLIDQKIEAEKDLFTYTSGFTPWFSYNSGKGLSLYLSGLLSLKHSGGNWTFIPELSSLVFNYRLNQGMAVEAGRVMYTDALGFTASGYFDGLRFEAVLPAGDISAGVFYTGLLYKETAKIIMTGGDEQRFEQPFDWSSPGSYTASSRLFAAVRWDMPIGEAHNLSAELLAQFDLNGGGQTLHSQYAAVKMEFYPAGMLRAEAGALVETMQNNSGGFGVAFGALARLRMDLPTEINDWLGVTAKFTSGAVNDVFWTFTPLNSITQGAVFPGTLAGLALVGADYSARITGSLFAEAALRYFIRTYSDSSDTGNFLGGEIWASLAWQPLEDIRATLGFGAFFPAIGNSDIYGKGTWWKISAGVSLSF